LADERPYLLGNQFSVADAYAFVILNWVQFIGFSLQPWPLVEAFRTRLGAHPSVLNALETEGLLPAGE
jgi:glutathione S-transferase